MLTVCPGPVRVCRAGYRDLLVLRPHSEVLPLSEQIFPDRSGLNRDSPSFELSTKPRTGPGKYSSSSMSVSSDACTAQRAEQRIDADIVTPARDP